jgi:hypothetical protein
MRNTEYSEKKERKRRYKVKEKFVTPHTNRAYEGVEVQLLLFLTLAQDRSRWSVSRPDHFTPSPHRMFPLHPSSGSVLLSLTLLSPFEKGKVYLVIC